MKYINPYEIATFIQFNNLDATTFKKFKRRLFAELELGDDEIIINSVKLHQNEIYELIDSIERDKNLLNIFKSLYENKELNNFLNGKSNENIKRLKNILSLENKQTIDFITKYLIQILSKIYKEAFSSKYKINILQIKPPLNEKYYEQIYEPVYQLLKNQEKELINLESNYYSFDEVKKIINDVKVINSLPDYFSKIRNDIASSIRNLSIDSWNNNENLDLAMDLIKFALTFKLNNKTKNEFLSTKDELNEIHKKQEIMSNIIKVNNILKSNKRCSKKLYHLIDLIDKIKWINILDKNQLVKSIHTLIADSNEMKNDKYLVESIKVNGLNSSELKLIYKLLKLIAEKLLKISSDSEIHSILLYDIKRAEEEIIAIEKNKEEKFQGYGMIIGIILGIIFLGFYSETLRGIVGAMVGGTIGLFIAKIINSSTRYT